MENRQLYALYVGINSYPVESNVPQLIGAIQDVRRMDAILRKHLPPEIAYHPLTLTNQEATRERIIREFRSHLGKASGNDMVLFMYCGHGDRQHSAPQFQAFYPDGQDETLVCYNSRMNGGHDLADKEVAVLLEEVTKDQVHCLVILDCCHSASGTRTMDDLKSYRIRTMEGGGNGHELATYLDGYYTEMYRNHGELSVPMPRHILFAACTRHQQAAEHYGGWGVFSHALANVLEDSRLKISYPELYQRCRREIMKISAYQTPQFESMNGVDATGGFLQIFPVPEKRITRRLPLVRELGHYYLPLGAIHGLDVHGFERQKLLVFEQEGPDSIVEASFSAIGMERSLVEFPASFLPDKARRYEALFTGFSNPFATYLFDGPADVLASFQAALPSGFEAVQGELSAPGHFLLSFENDQLHLFHRPSGISISYADPASPGTVASLADDLRQVTVWDHLKNLGLEGRDQVFPSVDIDFGYTEGRVRKKVRERENLDLDMGGDREGHFCPSIWVRNQEGQTLHFCLFYLSPDFGIHRVFQNEVASGPDWVDYWGTRGADDFYIPEGRITSVDTFVMIVSEFQPEISGLLWPDIQYGEKVSGRTHLGGMPLQKRWAVIGTQFTIYRSLGQIGGEELRIGNGVLTILPHEKITAKVALGGSCSPSHLVHPSRLGADLLLEMAGKGTLLSLGEDGHWPADVLRLSGFRGLQLAAHHPIEFELGLLRTQSQKLWCLAHTGGNKLRLLAEMWPGPGKKSTFQVMPAWLNPVATWIWFILVDESFDPSDLQIIE